MKLLTVIAALCCVVSASASVLEVGPISLTGSGGFYVSAIAEYNSYSFSAAGSNGSDTVSIIASDFQPWSSDLGSLETAVGDGQSAFGHQFTFGAGSTGQCYTGVIPDWEMPFLLGGCAL